VVQLFVGNQPVKVQKRDAAETNSQMVNSTNQGVFWYANSSKNLLYKIYGKVITYGSPQTVAKDYLQRVGITLQVSNDANLKVKTQARVLNKPEVTSP